MIDFWSMNQVLELCKCETTRERVLRMGKTLRLMQTKQKVEQVEAKQRGETPVTWKEWLEDKNGTGCRLPSERQCRYYALISRYPGAYKQGMSKVRR